jgi:hypothetical protein
LRCSAFRHAYGAGGAAGHPRSRYSAVARCQGLRPLREPFNRLIFHVRASYEQETDFLLRQLQGTGRLRVAVFYQDDELGGRCWITCASARPSTA